MAIIIEIINPIQTSFRFVCCKPLQIIPLTNPIPFTHFDQPDLMIFQNLKFKSLSRWNSLSNDEMVRIREDRFMLDFHKFNTRIPPPPPPSNMLPKSNMVQMANVTVMPKSDEPRKFSKYNPPRKRRSRNATEELIYIRQNFPSERY